jgi:hypothetical protein
LRGELQELQEADEEDVARLLQTGARLAELGDSGSEAQVEEALATYNARRQSTLVERARQALLLLAALLALRLLLALRRRSVESRLL